MFMAMGPHSGLGNYTRTAEYSVEWITELLDTLRRKLHSSGRYLGGPRLDRLCFRFRRRPVDERNWVLDDRCQ